MILDKNETIRQLEENLRRESRSASELLAKNQNLTQQIQSLNQEIAKGNDIKR